jgi:phospholipid/cholesterol/gamma-HCH transport system substrate-binding protein
MTQRNSPLLKFGVFAAVMLVLSGFLLLVFGDYRTGSRVEYAAVFTDSSGLRSGNTVRIAGVEVGTVRAVSLRDDHKVRVTFDAERGVALTNGTAAAVRYLNLVGDRYLELSDTAGSTEILRAGSEIPVERTSPALDLDLLLGGLKPVIQGLNAHEVNALTWSLLEIFQGKEGTLDSLLSRTSSFTTALAGHSEVIGQVIDHLGAVMATLAKDGEKFAGAIDRLEQLVTHLSQDRDPIAEAIVALDNGTATIAGGHRRSARAAGPAGRPGQAAAGRRLAAGAGQLPQAGAHRRLRQLRPVLHLRGDRPGDRRRGAGGGAALDRAENRKV